MSDKLLQLQANFRHVFGKKNKARRREGYIPANIVSSGKSSVAIEIIQADLIKSLNQVGYTQALELIVEDKKKTVLVTDVSFKPLTETPQHVVFFEVSKGVNVHALVPIELTGESPGERKGLMVLQMLNEVEVTAPALNIPDSLPVDMSSLVEDGDVIRIDHLSLPEAVQIQLDPQTPLARLEKSRAQVSQENIQIEDQTEDLDAEENDANEETEENEN